VPAGLKPGPQTVQLQIGGASSNIGAIAVQ
jgi:hypothetical protein